MMRYRFPVLSACLVMLAFAQNGHKPDFSGTWVLNLTKSKLEISPPAASTFWIDHQEPAFRLKRMHVYAGEHNTWSIDLTTDGKEVVQQQGKSTFHVTLRWDGDALVFDSYWLEGDARTNNLVRYTLSKDGAVFTADERVSGPDAKHHNIWVFDRE